MPLRVPGLVVAGVLLGAAAYELSLALGAGSTGPAAGDDVPGARAVALAAFLATITAIGVAIAYTARPTRVAALLAPAAAAFLAAFFFTYDPYYAPQLRRYADGGAIPGRWIVFVSALALGTAAWTWRRPRAGAAASAPLLLLLLGTTVLAGDGH